MNVIVTSGGTIESIDSVRSIVNTSSGKLGSLIASKFANKDVSVYYVYNGHTFPSNTNITPILSPTVNELEIIIKDLLTTKKIHAVIHAMAVSDFKPKSIINLKRSSQIISEKIANKSLNKSEIYEITQNAFYESENPLNNSKKISFFSESNALILANNKKIISIIKELSPKTLLVGFKLMSHVSENDLYNTSFNLLKLNRADFVVANDIKNINENMHKAFIIDESGNYEIYKTKKDIANAIVYKVCKLMGQLITS